jgi:hypothetical protein
MTTTNATVAALLAVSRLSPCEPNRAIMRPNTPARRPGRKAGAISHKKIPKRTCYLPNLSSHDCLIRGMAAYSWPCFEMSALL